VCQNQDWVSYVLAILLAHGGLSIVSAAMKKCGITRDSPLIGIIVPIIRVLALDLKPPPAVIVAQAQAIQNAPKG